MRVETRGRPKLYDGVYVGTTFTEAQSQALDRYVDSQRAKGLDYYRTTAVRQAVVEFLARHDET